MNKSIEVTDQLYEYLLDHNLRESDAQRALRERTATMPEAELQIGAEQSSLLSLLVRLIGAKEALEIGVFTGYSALTVARALPPEGLLIACDVSKEWTSIGLEYWKRDGVADKIDLRLGPALHTLDGLIADGRSVDFTFIDADKENVGEYYERVMKLLRPGGVVCIDNTLWGGEVANPKQTDPSTLAMREINRRVHDDERVNMALLNVADGMLVAMKK